MMRQDQQILPSLISNQENRCLDVQLPYQNKKNFMYGSLITVPTSRNQKLKEMNSRIQQFCQQEKLLAEKGVQLQYLAQQKKQHMGQNDSFFSDIHSMENKVTQFQLQVENLRHENRTQRFLLNQKDKIIQNLREQNLNLNHELNESRSKIIALRQLQQSVFSFLTQIYIISNQLPELYEKLNNHRENLAKTIQILRAYKKENTAMRSHLQTLTNEAKLNQQFMDSRITQRKSLLEQKTKLFLLNIELQEKITAKNRQISNLNRKIDRDLQQKLEKEFQVKRMKKLIEEQTNYLKEEITKITQVVRKGYKEHQRIEEKSKKKYQFVVEDKMNVIRILEKRLKELQQSMTIKDERIDRLELIIKRHADRSSRIVSMANQFSPFFNKIEARVEKNNRVLEQVISQRGQLIDENDLMN